jgi:Fic family protein
VIDNGKFEQLMRSLHNIETKLDILINLQRTSIPKPKVPKEEAKILKLCDKKHTIADMVSKTGKKNSYIRKILTQLRKKGLIVSIKSNGKTVYGKV